MEEAERELRIAVVIAEQRLDRISPDRVQFARLPSVASGLGRSHRYWFAFLESKAAQNAVALLVSVVPSSSSIRD